jgi:hypothetical protein
LEALHPTEGIKVNTLSLVGRLYTSYSILRYCLPLAINPEDSGGIFDPKVLDERRHVFRGQLEECKILILIILALEFYCECKSFRS